jgi:Clostripain family
VPTITLKDERGHELLNTNLTGEGLGKYLKSAVSLRSVVSIAHLLSKPLSDASGARELGLAIDKDVPVGKNNELSLTVGGSVKIGLHESGSEIFAGSDLQAPVAVPNGTVFSSLTLEALLKAGLAGTQGSIGFGFQAGTALRYAYFHPFNIVGTTPSVADSVKTMLSAAVFPADADDLRRVPVGAFVSLAGEGELSFSGQAALSSTTSLLATPGLPIVGSVAVTAGATVNVGAEWTASGEFELRLAKPDPSKLHLSFHRRRGRSLSVSAKAMAGVSATAKGKELLAALMRAISADPEADLLTLVNAGLDDASIEAIQHAIAASIDRSLTLSAQLQVSALGDEQALFAYDVDLTRLDDGGKAAIGEALHGQLSKIGEAAASETGPIRLVASAAKQLRERKTSWRINLLGILNVGSFVDLVRDGTVTFDPVSGALTAADNVSSRRIRVKERPLESDSEKLRKVLFESLMVTAAYQASRVLGATLTLTAEQMYLEQRGKTRRQDLEDHYRALIALGLCNEHERDARLGMDSDFGRSTFVIENHFSSAACDAMFLDSDGKPHAREHYETIARQALLTLIPGNDPTRSYRRLALEADATWERVRTAGGALASVLPSHIRNDALRLGVVRGDVFTIIWWAKAMSRAAEELVELRTFLGQRNAATLATDKAFAKARGKLSDALAGVVAQTEARFDDPWDVLAMDAAAARLGRLESVIISTRFAASYAEADVLAAATPARVSRSMRAAAAAAPSEAAERDWTADERDVFAHHVVNLREGRLSTSGSFSSSPEQVGRIFTEFIPEYVKAQRALGRPARVLFFAHSGLVEEREGLLPVLARRRFWELNGVYPVYFVWETGLKETIRDILGSVAPTRDVRGALTDVAIEKLARNGGKQVWGQMKKSAEKAADPDGGGRLVADLAGKLWKAMNGEIEFHALGHSAGSILHAYFLPLLVAPKPAGVPRVDVRTLHFLAPAITTDLFKDRLKKLIGQGQPITRLTTYTMSDELEQSDSSLKPYGKSLLYLVSNAFEDAVPTPILGLQKSLKQDLQLIRFFGLAGTEKVADIVFSGTPDGAPPSARSQSITHGGFDNDVATMTSVIRRVLDGPDTQAVTDYFEESIPGFARAAVGIAAGAPAPGAARAIPARAAAVRAASRRKKWTVMVWMAGDNNLESFGEKDIAEMKRVGSNDDVNIVVQFDSMKDDHTRRYEVTSGSDVEADIVQELGETNTGDPLVAIDFFRWAIDRYPAERLLGVIWNHGAGIDDTDIYARSALRSVDGSRGVVRAAMNGERSLVRRTLSSRHRRALFGTTVAQATQDRAIAFDDTSRDFLDNVELKRVLAEVQRQTKRTFDVLGFDACLMNMIEVAYQLKGTSQVVVGSEELEPGEGWPYDRVLETISANPEITASELGSRIVDLYVESYREDSVTQSAFDLEHLDGAADAVDALAKALTKAIKDPAEFAAVSKALNATQRFDTADFVDLGHFCRELSKRSKAASVKSAAKATVDALEARGGFVLAERHRGASVGNASGVSIYFPRGPVNKAYSRLDFARRVGWRGFLDAFHKA